MTSTGMPPVNPTHDRCRGYVTIGYFVDCGAEGRSAGFDTKGQYCLRVSVKWKNKHLGNEPGYYLGSPRRGQSHHAPSYSEDVVNIDTWFEGNGNQTGNGRADDTVQIANQQAAVVEQAEKNGHIPPGVIEVSHDGGSPGSSYAEVKIWCPEKVDLGGHSFGKFTFSFFSCGMPHDVEIEPAPEPREPGTGGWRGPLPPATGQGPKPTIVPPGFVQIPKNVKEPRPMQPADPEKGRELRDSTVGRLGKPEPRPGRSNNSGSIWGQARQWPQRDPDHEYGLVVMLVGGRLAINAQLPGGVDVNLCHKIHIDGRGSESQLCHTLYRAAIRLGLKASFVGGKLRIARGGVFPPGGVFGLMFIGGPENWFHLQVSNLEPEDHKATIRYGETSQECCWHQDCACNAQINTPDLSLPIESHNNGANNSLIS